MLKSAKHSLAKPMLGLTLSILLSMETAMAQAMDDIEARNKATVEAVLMHGKMGPAVPMIY